MVRATTSTAEGQTALEPTNHVVLEGVDWQTYSDLRDQLDRGSRHVKLFYDNGHLLIEMPNKFHEVVKGFVRALLEAYLIDHDIDYSPLGATTWKRSKKLKGLEADECYYIQHADIADRHDEVDLEIDPPPDLAIEVEVTVPLLEKLPIYAAIGVPELWHLKGWDDVQILVLDESTMRYNVVSESGAIPGMTASRLRESLQLRRERSFGEALIACRVLWR